MDKTEYRAKCTVDDEIRIFRISLLRLCTPGIPFCHLEQATCRRQVKAEMNAFHSIPVTNAECPTSRSFFARCGIPQACPSSLSRSLQLYTGAPRSHQRCPDFLLRSTRNDHACGFLSKKAA
jgi:hypothetical protein